MIGADAPTRDAPYNGRSQMSVVAVQGPRPKGEEGDD